MWAKIGGAYKRNYLEEGTGKGGEGEWDPFE